MRNNSHYGKKPSGHNRNSGVQSHEFPLPRTGEVIGTVIKGLGASNFSVLCSDDKQRLCTIPGKLKRRFWIKEGDVVIVRPWAVQPDTKGDIIWRYSILDKDILKQRGYKI
jgi:translation initiation factor 1A